MKEENENRKNFEIRPETKRKRLILKNNFLRAKLLKEKRHSPISRCSISYLSNVISNKDKYNLLIYRYEKHKEILGKLLFNKSIKKRNDYNNEINSGFQKLLNHFSNNFFLEKLPEG